MNNICTVNKGGQQSWLLCIKSACNYPATINNPSDTYNRVTPTRLGLTDLRNVVRSLARFSHLVIVHYVSFAYVRSPACHVIRRGGSQAKLDGSISRFVEMTVKLEVGHDRRTVSEHIRTTTRSCIRNAKVRLH